MTQDESPFVSVITPALNAEDTIVAAVNSVLAQSHHNWEMVIVSDDGVDYGTILAENGITDSRIRFASTSEIGAGPARARNVGLDAASYDIISLLDADDTIHPEKLKLDVEKLAEAPIITCGLELTDSAGNYLMQVGVSPKTQSGVMDAWDFLRHNYSGFSMVTYDRNRIGDIRYDETLPALEDYEFMHRCFCATDTVYHHAIPLYNYQKNKAPLEDEGTIENPFHKAKIELIRRLNEGEYNFRSPDTFTHFLEFDNILMQAGPEYERRLQETPDALFESVICDLLEETLRPETIDVSRTSATDIQLDIRAIFSDTSRRASWVEPPTAHMFPYVAEIRDDADLASIIASYHSIPKDQYDTILDRCCALDEASHHIGNLMEAGNNSHGLANLRNLILNKREYLYRIKEMLDTGILVDDVRIYDAEVVRGYFESFDHSTGYQPILLNDRTFYDSVQGKLWGDYKLETIDPAHRQLEHYKSRWEDLPAEGRPPFFLWLEEQDIAPTFRYTDFLSEQEMETCKVHIKDGFLYVGKGASEQLLNTDQMHEAVFVIMPNGDIYTSECTDHIRHASLSHGRPLIGVGTWKIRDGEIVELRSDSGHYLPNELAIQTINVIDNLGIEIRDDVPFYYYQNSEMKITTVGEFRQKNFASSRSPEQQAPNSWVGRLLQSRENAAGTEKEFGA